MRKKCIPNANDKIKLSILPQVYMDVWISSWTLGKSKRNLKNNFTDNSKFRYY